MQISRTAFLAILLTAATAKADDAKDPFADNLLGDPYGMRSALLNKGVDVVVEYKGDFVRNMSGGIKRGGDYLDNLDVKFSLDGEKLFGLEGNKSLIYFLNNDGGKPNQHQVGSLMGVDNIEVAKDAPKLYEAWTEQSFFHDKLTVLVGLHDLNSEFMAPDITANFQKPSMQVEQTLAQTGNNGPSIFPTTSLAGRVKYIPFENSYISVAAFDGIAGNPSHPYDTRVDLNKGDGVLWIAEAGRTPKIEGSDDTANKFALGAWSYSSKFDDVVDVDAAGNPVKRRAQGAYFTSAYQFYNDKATGHTLGAFLRAGIADGDTARTKWDYETGIVANSWVPDRRDSEIGIGIAQAHNSSKYDQLVAGVGTQDEYSAELYYRDTVYRGVRLQPDLQYIINPGSSPAQHNATVLTVRTDINFLKQDIEISNDL